MLGDINNDGIINFRDYLIAYDYLLNETNPEYQPYPQDLWQQWVTYIENVMLYIMVSNFQLYSAYLKPGIVNPRVMLRWSDDGGHTWGNEHWANTGNIGEYGKRVIWRRLGMTTKLRDRVYEISGSDPVKIAIMGAELTATPTSA